MKLYTEQELRKHLYNHSDEFFDQLTPIELPSDMEIEKAADELTNIDVDYWSSFLRGAKWMKEQILNQNK